MRESRSPALIASVALHLAVLGAGFIVWPFASKPIQMAASVPITIVSKAPPDAPTAPVLAPEPTPETSPAPSPEPTPAPPPPAPPTPAPKPVPTPPKPVPIPAPAPKPPPASSPTPRKVESKPVDLTALAASLPQSKAQPNKAARAAKPFDLAALAATLPKSGGAKGAPHPATAPTVAPGPPRPLSGDELGAVTSKLMRLWNPNCGVEGADKVVIRVGIHLTPDGHLARPPELLDRAVVDAGGPVAQAAAQRALNAVVRGEPYTELPRDHYAEWKDFNARFPGKEACAGH